jgi:ATP-binding cassette subfamily F protein 3
MNYKIVNGSISYGAETILEEINFEIKDKDKIAIVGRNGGGKTTLLKALVNNEMLEEGIGEEKFNIYKQGSPVIGYLKQIEFEDDSATLLDEILKAYTPLVQLEEKIARLEKELQTNTDENLIKDYTKALDLYKFQDGYVYKKEYETALQKFGFSSEDKSKKISQFSGGQRTKIAFLRLLLSKPDILLLDEPTNHLDITTIEWLENYLKNYPKAVCIVSHDRMFLDKIVNKVYEIEYATITAYTGNYASFEKQKRMNYEKQLSDYEYQQAEIKRLQAIADRFRYKPTKAKMALSKLRKIEQMTIVKQPNKYDLKTFHSNFNIEVQSGNMVLSAHYLEIGYDKILSKISLELYKGQKLAIIGENGTGKSTFLKTLIGDIPKLGGNFEFGYHVNYEYFDQQMSFTNPNQTVFDEYYNTFPNLTTTQARTDLGTFLFSGDDVFKEINVLSGGEKVRLQLCKILKKGPNLLILDEPTNHMDIVGKESLENILKEYSGTLILVSHDRYFVNKIADCLLIFKRNGVQFFNGTYEEYMQSLEGQPAEEVFSSETIVSKEKKTTNDFFIAKEKRKIENRINKIESLIEQKELDIKSFESEMLSPENCSDFVKLEQLQNKIQEINNEIEELMIEWEELSEK